MNFREVVTLSPLNNSMPFLLAELAKRKSFSSVEDLARDVLKDPQQFLLFIQLFVETDPYIADEELSQFIVDWYSKMDICSLVQMICEEPHHLSTHREAMNLANFESAHLAVQVVKEYLVNGLEAASSTFGNAHPADIIIECFAETERMKNNMDADLAKSQIIFHGQSLMNTNASLLKKKEVMKVLIKRMDLHQLMLHLNFMSEEGFFKIGDEWDALFIRRVEDKLTDFESIERSNIQPSESLVIREGLSMVSPSIPLEIITSLDKQLEKAFMNVKETDVDITVAINCHRLQGSQCVGLTLSAVKAAAVLALTLQRSGRNVKIFTFEDCKRIEIRETCFASLSSVLASRSHIDSSHSVSEFASKVAGSLVLIGHSFDMNEFCQIAEERNGKVKMVLCNLCDIGANNGDHDDILSTSGFNENTSDIISSFFVLKQLL